MSNKKAGIKDNTAKRGREVGAATDQIVLGESRTREDDEIERMMQRKPMGVSLQLEVPNDVKRKLLDDDCEARWVLESNVAKNTNFDWKMVQKDGKNITMPSGPTVLYLMKLPTKVFKHRKALEAQATNERLGEEAKRGMDYVPDGHESALTVERY